MFDIFARSFSVATRTERPRRAEVIRNRGDLPRLSWLEEDLPFRHHAGRRSGRHD